MAQAAVRLRPRVFFCLCPMDSRRMLGRQDTDHERMFPKNSTASAASKSEVTVNGKVIRIWDYAQLETLSSGVLLQRVLAIRDAVGPDNCAPMPSKQVPDLIRWILHMQTELTSEKTSVGRGGAGVPPWFAQDDIKRPISPLRNSPQMAPRLPFGLRHTDSIEAARDHYNDMLEKKNEFAEVPKLGITTMRPGGEGRRHIEHGSHMENNGVPRTESKTGEGRRHIHTKDHLQEQTEELDAISKGTAVPESRKPAVETHTYGGHGVREVLSAADQEPREPGMSTFFDRKRHIDKQDHMLNHGTADASHWETRGRKNQEAFARPATTFNGTDPGYQSNWKQNPSRLQGTSLLV
uniref:Uncharacterized protein n=1 Tax=Noctiluca scintillans TaxID=2966 RepID=A0A7S0ZWI5_NOCSC